MMKLYIFTIFMILLIFQLNIVKSQEEDEEILEYYVHFDMSDPDIKIIDKDNSNPEIKDITSHLRSVKIPNVELDKDDYFFSGWTEDGIFGYTPGDVIVCKSKNTTLKPVFGLLADKRTFILDYLVEFEGQIVPNTNLPKVNYCKNRIVETSLKNFPQQNATQRGWITEDKIEFFQGQKLVMPEHNLTLYALYFYHHNLKYDSGNVDGIVGLQYDIFTLHTRGTKELAEATRIQRKGYEMIAWHCENDGKDYPFFYPYVMPDEDVIMTAVWKPITYNAVFKTGVNSISSIKILGETGKFITAPFIDEKREGYTFVGWKIYNNQIYYPGEEIIVIGQTPGTGISANAIWEKE